MEKTEQGRCVFYARVATREQLSEDPAAQGKQRAYTYARVEGGSPSIPGADFSHAMLEAQSERLREYAEAMGYEVTEQDVELARLGITETGWEKMLKVAASGEVQTLIVTSCSRLHRDSDKAIDLLEKLDRCGVRIYSQQEGWVNVPREDGQPTMLQLLQMLRSTERKEGALNVFS